MNKEKKNLIVFGYGLAVILLFISYRIWSHQGWTAIHAALIPLALMFVLITAVNFQWLKPVYTQWMKLAHVLGAIVTGIILSLMFYLVFGVAGIILRVMRKDLLDRTLEPERTSYWINRTDHLFEREHYTKQY